MTFACRDPVRLTTKLTRRRPPVRRSAAKNRNAAVAGCSDWFVDRPSGKSKPRANAMLPLMGRNQVAADAKPNQRCDPKNQEALYRLLQPFGNEEKDHSVTVHRPKGTAVHSGRSCFNV